MASSSSSTSPMPEWTYDVFLSFRGEDTRNNFTSHLYRALDQAGIFTFRDSERLERGKEINPELIRAIEGSRFSIVVFSEGYASSTWCLDELVKILECSRTLRQTIIPVFYKVDPSHIRKPRGRIEEALIAHQVRIAAERRKVDKRRRTTPQREAFARHQVRFACETDKVERWRAALTEAASIAGYHISDRHDESKEIYGIVKVVQNKVNRNYLHVAKQPVGLTSRVQEIKSLLCIGLDDIRVVGIFGMGGVGKTTIAKAVYNEIFNDFEGSCFIANVREASEQPDGIVRLQERILFEILKTENFKVGNIANGISCLKERLRSKKVLIILDDLNHISQVDSLAGQCDWFRPGSRIIVTTRNVDLLTQSQIDIITYEAKQLTHGEPLKLFSLHAFGMDTPSDDYLQLSKSIVTYADGLPLALEVLGSYLCGRIVSEWESAFDKLQRTPHDRIQAILRISYDGLGDDHARDAFRDIACFFIGMEKDYAINILKACGFFPEIEIRHLIDRCLLTIDENNKLMMHNLIRDMGREIVRQENLRDPGRRSRLWFNEDIYNVLQRHKGTEATEGIVPALRMSMENPISSKTFEKMRNLRLLQINYVHLHGSFENLLEELKWLSWQHCPLEKLPSDFLLENLVVLDLQYSNLTCVWQGKKNLQNLTILYLGHCSFLTITPDFTEVPKLKKLYLNGCTSLLEFHPSIVLLNNLSYLNLEDCKKLKELPGCICELKSLACLNLNGCSNLENLPENMECLSDLSANGTAFKQLTDSLGHLKKLKSLCLDGNSFHSLPSSVGQLPNLELLSVNNCRSLQLLPELPPKLVWLYANGCTSMEKLPNLSNANKFLRLYLMNCTRLAAIQGLENLSSVRLIAIEGCSDLTTTFGDSFFQGYSEHAETSDMYLPRRHIPDWFNGRSMGSSISFDILPGQKFLGMTLWIVYEGTKYGPVMTLSPEAIIMNRTNGVELRHTCPLSYGPHNPGHHSWVCRIPVSYLGCPIRGGEQLDVSFEINQPLEVKQCGYHLIYEPNIEKYDQGQFPDVDGDVDSAGVIVDNMRPKRVRRKLVVSFLRRMLTLKG